MKKIIAVMLATIFILSVQAFAEPLVDTDIANGHVTVTSYYVAEEGEYGTYLYIIFDWTNNGDGPMNPLGDFIFIGFQNGKQIESDCGYDQEPKNTDGYYGVQVMPGYTTTGFEGFKISDLSEVTISINSWFADDSTTFTIDPETAPGSEEISKETTQDEVTPAAAASDEVTIEDLLKRIEDLEQRVAALEGN